MPLSLLDPRVLLGLLVFFLLSSGVQDTLFYMRGRDDMKAAYTSQQLDQANANLAADKKQTFKAAAAGAAHDQRETQVIHDTRTILQTVKIPPDSDPFVPVWFVRLHDRYASRWAGGDPYPTKSDGDASDIRLSQAVALLATNYEGCAVNTGRLNDIIDLHPVMPPLPDEPSFWDRINPFTEKTP